MNNQNLTEAFKEIYEDNLEDFLSSFSFYRNKLKYDDIEILKLTPKKKKGKIKK